MEKYYVIVARGKGLSVTPGNVIIYYGASAKAARAALTALGLKAGYKPVRVVNAATPTATKIGLNRPVFQGNVYGRGGRVKAVKAA